MRLDLIFMTRYMYNNSKLDLLTKFRISSRNTKFKYILHETSLKERPNQHENSHKLGNEMGHPFWSLKASQWKLRQQHDQDFLMERKPL